MGLFVCDNCGVIENSSLGSYNNAKRHDRLFGEEYANKAFCSECSPSKFKNGSTNDKGGKWHGLLAKDYACESELIIIIKSNRYLPSIKGNEFVIPLLKKYPNLNSFIRQSELVIPYI